MRKIIKKIVCHPIYFIFIIFVIIPVSIDFIIKGHILFGIIAILLQIPYLFMVYRWVLLHGRKKQ